MLRAYRVLDLTDGRAELGPFILAGLGADVVKVEPPGGSAARREPPSLRRPAGLASLRFHAFNRGKRSVVLDLDDADGPQRIPRASSASADFLFENAGPGAMAAPRPRLRRAAAAMQPRPRLRRASRRSGRTGPYAHHLATDLTLAAMGGMMALNGDADRRPVRITVPQTWYHAAAESAVAALVAHARRLATGRGAVRRRLGAGGGVLDRAQRDDRPRHPGQGHRAQRHHAAAQHARHAARLSLRRRRGGADRDHRDAATPGAAGCSRTARSRGVGRRPRTGRPTRSRMLTGGAAGALAGRGAGAHPRLLRRATPRPSCSSAASPAARRSRR